MLRVADKLGCKTVSDTARNRLRQLWPLTVPEGTAAWKEKDLNETLAIIALARQFNVPELLKRAFYELIRDASFWEMIHTDRDSVELPDSDLLALYHARHELQQEWRTLILTPPSPGSSCLSLPHSGNKCRYTVASQRSVSWRTLFVASCYLDKGSEDQIYYVDFMVEDSVFDDHAGKLWCTPCIEERKNAWEDAKAKWWKMLDELFKVPAAEGNED